MKFTYVKILIEASTGTPRVRNSLALAISLAGWIALSSHSAIAAQPVPGQTLQGRITQITTEKVTIDGIHTFKLDPKKTQCFDHRGDKTSCATLAAVGYADSAIVTIVGDSVQRIDIKQLQQ
jgi:hypothetical protein